MSIASGETVDVILPITDDTFLWWDPVKADMVPVHGSYCLLYGGNSRDLKQLDYKY